MPSPLPKKIKKLKGYPLWEIVSGDHRILFPIIKNKHDYSEAWLVHAFRKDSQKTRQQDIDKGMLRRDSKLIELGGVNYGF